MGEHEAVVLKPNPKRPYKALTAAVMAGAGAITSAASDGALDAGEWAFVGFTVVAAGLAVYGIPNPMIRPKPPE